MGLNQKDVAYEFFVSLTDLGDPQQFVVNPTIAAGDFKRSVDGGSFANLATLPVVEPAGSSTVKISLSAIEMSGDKGVDEGKDVSGDEWGDISIFLDNPVGTVDNILDIMEGDHIETSTRLIVNKKGTNDALLDKDVAGSLLRSDITVTTVEN